MAKKTVMLTPAEKAKRKYEAEKRGKVVLRVQLSSTDDAVQWEKIRDGLVERYGSAKDGIYQLAVKDGLLDD